MGAITLFLVLLNGYTIFLEARVRWVGYLPLTSSDQVAKETLDDSASQSSQPGCYIKLLKFPVFGCICAGPETEDVLV